MSPRTLRQAIADHPRVPPRHPRRPPAGALQRLGRVHKHQDPAHRSSRFRLPLAGGPHRLGDARPRWPVPPIAGAVSCPDATTTTSPHPTSLPPEPRTRLPSPRRLLIHGPGARGRVKDRREATANAASSPLTWPSIGARCPGVGGRARRLGELSHHPRKGQERLFFSDQPTIAPQARSRVDRVTDSALSPKRWGQIESTILFLVEYQFMLNRTKI